MISVIILAGGQGKRLGVFKPLIKLGNKILIEWNIEELVKCNNFIQKIVISIKNENQKTLIEKAIKNFIRIRNSKILFAKDMFTETSPLLGIISAIVKLESNYFFVCGADQPFLSCELIKKLYAEIENFDAIVPRWENGYIEPLTAIYVKSVFERTAKKLLKNKEMSLHKLVFSLNTKFIPIEMALKEYIISFVNINTKKDLERARKILKEIGKIRRYNLIH
ncbi:MAG: molybdenum cofactor guanylyltransferase [Candidatus Asgardarchaeia archaeon]